MRLKLPSREQLLFLCNVIADKWLFKQKYDEGVRKILVIRWDEIGDMATSTHVFEILKKHHPKSEITLICKPFVKSLVEHDPNIDAIVCDLNAFNRHFDLVVELRGTFSSLLKAFRYGVKYRVSRADIRWKNRGNQLHEIDTNFKVIQPILPENASNARPKLYYSEKDIQLVEEFLNSGPKTKFAIIHAGARRKLRQWNPERFALAVEFLHRKYNLEIVFAGTVEDEDVINLITSDLGFRTYNFTRGFSLSQFSFLCSKASFYLGNESGPLHIASAFDVPMIALFGPGVPDVFYPVSPNSKVLHHVLPCNPCDQIHCVHPDNPCISRIQANDVLETITQILQS